MNIRQRAKVSELTHNLGERVKELNCLYGISRIFELKPASLEEVLRSVVELIPPAWQYPEITCARIKLKKKDFATNNFIETRWCQQQNIIVNRRQYGILQVCYLEPRPDFDEGPFLKEERNLLLVIAERLGLIIEHYINDRNLEILYHKEKELRQKLQTEMQSRVDITRKLIHELKTPLTSLIATSQLLADETKNERLGKLARYIFEGAGNMNRRIDELHDVMRGETGQLKLTLKYINMEKLLNSILEEVQPLAASNGVTTELEVEGKIPEIKADPERLHQVILNLLNNAFTYAREGKKVKILESLRENNILIEVRDYGPGISMEKRQTLFEPGYQVAYREQSTGGLGIGLSLCKMLVDLHGGRIWAKSRIGRGTSFFFTLPIRTVTNGN
jgi:signal transduction histidine kinase